MPMVFFRQSFFGFAFIFLLPMLSYGAAGEIDTGATAWILTSTGLVLFMTLPGLALFYGGLVGSRNVLSVLMHCFSIAAVVSLLWMIGLYSLAFDTGNQWIGGLSKVFLSGLSPDSVSGSIPEGLFVMFQMTFAIITPALIVGAFAERMKFSAMLLFTSLWTIIVYAPVTHWVWGGGWLQQMGLLDYAGGTVVHVTAGVAALISALMVGKRKGFPKVAMPPHNMTMTVTGAGLLWVGWFGFNAGSALEADGHAAMAMLATHISAAAGAIAWTAIEWKKYGKPSALGIVTGMVAGLGTITPASGFVGPGGALVIGLLAGLVCFNMTYWVKQKLHIDDSLDVFPVHGVGGILGTLAVGIFSATTLGPFSGWGFAEGISSMGMQLGVQAIGVLSVGAYTAVCTWVLLKVIGALIGLRVDEESETVGLDISEHEEKGYNL